MKQLLWVSLGGALGTAARYLLGDWLARLAPNFPLATLVINASGSFMLCALMELALHSSAVPPWLRITITTGVMGGFTTYSTFNYETLQLIEDGALLLAGWNVLTTVVGCLLAGLLGTMLVRGWLGP